MVAHTRAATRAHRLRPLNQPRPIRVEAGESGEPQAVVLERERLTVAAVQDRWRIDDEWWRERPVSRLYYLLLLEDGQVVTVYQDLIGLRWARQAY
ncbi:MAG: hypothetical protein MUP14_05760 [Dehalococcoidia bacterium]|nr:hypothetical protein [Dehalococcoidia bacterium]